MRFLNILFLLTLPAAAQIQFNHTTNNGTLTITGCFGDIPNLVIPDSINGLPVTAIADGVFDGWSGLTSITLPKTLLSIGQYSFSSCTGLTNVTLPDSLKDVGGYSFSNCSNLCSVAIPNGVTVIGWGVFRSCSKLGSVTIPPSVVYLGRYAFDECVGLTNVSLLSSFTNISDHTFFGCTSLTTITIPNGITTIANSAFFGCSSLINVRIPDSLETIEDWAFRSCNSLTSITFHNRLKTLGKGVFYACSSLSAVYFEGDAPRTGPEIFNRNFDAVVYYMAGTKGWSAQFAGRPVLRWQRPNPVILGNDPTFGVNTDGFGFTISWSRNASLIVEANSGLESPIWTPISTNVITYNTGSFHFVDPLWKNYPARLYRVKSSESTLSSD